VRYDKKCALVLMQSASYSCAILMKFEVSRHFFRKVIKYKISLISIKWEPSCSMRTDGRTDMTKLIVVFRNFAKVPEDGKHSCLTAPSNIPPSEQHKTGRH